MLVSRLERLGLGILTVCVLLSWWTGSLPRLGVRRNADGAPSARFTVYFVLALCLFPQADYLEVLRLVKAGEPERFGLGRG